MRRTVVLCLVLTVVVLGASSDVAAQRVDLTVFVGRAYPIYDDRLTLRPTVASPAGIEVTPSRPLELRTDGGLVLGAAAAVELGILGIEGRLDSMDLAFDVRGTRLDLRATSAPFQGLTGSVTIGDGRLEVDRVYLRSLNLRLRTPGPIGVVASGGLSYLSGVTVAGSVPLSLQIAGVPILPAAEPRLRLRAVPGEPEHRFGVNGGAGLRIGGRHVGIMGEVRVFYFREFQLRFAVDDAPQFVGDVVDSLTTVRFEPVFVNAQVGLVLRFW